MRALCPQHREKTVTAGCSHEPCNALHKQSRCSRRFTVSHPHKENCVQLINYAFKRRNDKNAIIRLAKDNGRSIHVLFIDKSGRRKHNVRCVCLSEIICMCTYVSSLTLKSSFYFFVCLLLFLPQCSGNAACVMSQRAVEPSPGLRRVTGVCSTLGDRATDPLLFIAL